MKKHKHSKQNPSVCPGCSRHCPKDGLRCKRGRAYFEKTEKAEKKKAEASVPGRRKWEKLVGEGSALRPLFLFSRQAKKALRGGLSEASLLAPLSADEQQQLARLLARLNDALPPDLPEKNKKAAGK